MIKHFEFKEIKIKSDHIGVIMKPDKNGDINLKNVEEIKVRLREEGDTIAVRGGIGQGTLVRYDSPSKEIEMTISESYINLHYDFNLENEMLNYSDELLLRIMKNATTVLQNREDKKRRDKEREERRRGFQATPVGVIDKDYFGELKDKNLDF